MNIKNIVFVSLVLLVIFSSLSMISAGLFDFGPQTVDIDGVNFTIPEGYEEIEPNNFNVETVDDISEDYKDFKVDTKVFEKTEDSPDHSGMAVICHDVIVSVISDSKDLTLDDVVDGSDFEKTTIGDKSGLLSEGSFYYVEDGKLVNIIFLNADDLKHEDIIAK
jgi:hypothetical protein